MPLDEGRVALLGPLAEAAAPACTCTPGRRYAFGFQNVAGLVGARARIRTRYGKLCCHGTGTAAAFQYAWTGVTRRAPFHWGQTGWGRLRRAGVRNSTRFRYAEVMGDTYHIHYDTAQAPAAGATNFYQAQVEPATGKWTFRFNGRAWKTFTDPAWVGARGETAHYVGEIMNSEDDMPGTAAHPCRFSDCAFRREGDVSFSPTSLAAGNMHTDDATQWAVNRLSATSFEIWDVNPNP